MKKIVHHYGADLDWVDSLAQQFEGEVKGNFIEVSKSIHTGSRYFLKCEEGIVALYVDVTYHTDLQLIQSNIKQDFIGMYYNLSQGDAELTFDDNLSNKMGKSYYNLSVIDSSLEFQYDIKAGNKAFIFCIFIKKELLKSYGNKNSSFSKKIEKITNPKKNTFIRLDRMSNESYHALSDLRKFKVGDISFDLNMMGTVYQLIADYLDKIAEEKTIIQLVNKSDLNSIILAQQFLIENLENSFPSNKLIAEKFNMSESKFKTLFKKITGIAPNIFFMENKLIKAKTLLEEKELSISEIYKLLSFTDYSYFASKFKKKFGILPKTFTQEL